ncbi:AraC-like DNA-binding protein [Litoreibacter ponti]|uniref:AraC-like DNA-binding protein n=1 Tax=Litoreibacter ponti TaxID=1510457 RepID=A0A2T6BKD2_9RHOB|nr:AraC family transcriptional regulator [Litoreibacter ponti]PTX56502.1 AraC-like DNA-binding protein [Litoreibacter ponti]
MKDVFKDLLDLMRVRSTAYVGKNMSEPWSILIDEHDALARFHLVVEGETWIGLPGGNDGVILGPGDLAIFPAGRAHEYRNPGNTAPPETRFLPDFDAGPYFHAPSGEPGRTNMLCGYFRLSERTPPAILSRLPDMIVERASDARSKVDMVIDLIREELLTRGPSSHIVLNRLTEILCVKAVSTWLEDALARDTHLQALADPRTKLVLDSIHADPTQDWTVESLARVYGQSRTAFAEHFKEATGLTPINYVRRWRIRLACTMLEESQMTIDEIAFKSGYSDTNAFNRAFKRETGNSPGAYKRMLRA